MKKKLFPLVFLLFLTAAAVAQLRVDVRLVNVFATVTDENGRYVEGLKASDFTLDEDGVRQQISHFNASTDQPVSVGILLDTSNSMERKISPATRAVDRFLRDIHEDDDIFLMTFDGSVKVRQDFTSDRDKLWGALQKIKLGAGTSLYDGVIQGTDKLKKGKYPKKAVLLISDGMDTSSEHDYDVARLAVRESEMLLYAMGIAPEGSAVHRQASGDPVGHRRPARRRAHAVSSAPGLRVPRRARVHPAGGLHRHGGQQVRREDACVQGRGRDQLHQTAACRVREVHPQMEREVAGHRSPACEGALARVCDAR